MSKEIKCLGCGATKQTTDTNLVGFAKDSLHDYCLECFKLKNYGEVKSHVHPESYPDILPKSVVLIIQSVMHLDNLFVHPINRIQPDAKYIYIINQIDLLPKDTNLDYIYEKITLKARQMKVKFFDIVFMSAIRKSDINDLKKYVNSLHEKNIYLFGIQNSGKTTIFKGLTNNDKALALNKVGLTQEIIQETVLDKTYYDMPGTFGSGYLHEFLTYNEYKNLIPSKTIKPRVYQMHKNQSVIVNDFLSVSNSTIDTTFVFYLSAHALTKKLNVKNIDKHLNDSYEYNTKSFKVAKGKHQITFGDLGFLIIEGPNTVVVKAHKKLNISLTDAYLK